MRYRPGRFCRCASHCSRRPSPADPGSIAAATPAATAATAIGAGEDLQPVAIRIIPIDAAAAVAVVDLTRPALAGIGPVGQPALADAAEDLIELVLAHEEGVVHHREVALVAYEVERDAVVELDAVERAESDGCRTVEDLGQEGRGGLRIAGRNNRVIQLNGHDAPQAQASGTATLRASPMVSPQAGLNSSAGQSPLRAKWLCKGGAGQQREHMRTV